MRKEVSGTFLAEGKNFLVSESGKLECKENRWGWKNRTQSRWNAPTRYFKEGEDERQKGNLGAYCMALPPLWQQISGTENRRRYNQGGMCRLLDSYGQTTDWAASYSFWHLCPKKDAWLGRLFACWKLNRLRYNDGMVEMKQAALIHSQVIYLILLVC